MMIYELDNGNLRILVFAGENLAREDFMFPTIKSFDCHSLSFRSLEGMYHAVAVSQFVLSCVSKSRAYTERP